MDAFEPGEGFREVSGTAEQPDLVEYIDGLPVRLWVREEPVPALPTEPYTVIRVTWVPDGGDERDADVLLLDEDGWWGPWRAEQLDITGFEVLAVPKDAVLIEFDEEAEAIVTDRVRHETAKAVLDRLRADLDEDTYVHVGREFGVEL